MKRNGIACALLLAAGLAGSAGAQNPELQQKLAEVKQAAAANKQALAQYTWTEQVTISVKGEQKKQEHFQVRLGPDGKPQKQSLDPPASPSAQDTGEGRRGGRLKEHVVQKKTEEYKEYADSIKTLIAQYIPPDKDLLEQAAQKGNVALSPAPGDAGQYRLSITNYIKQGDSLVLQFDKARKALVSVNINTYLDDPKDAVNVAVDFTSEPDGLSHVASENINGVSKQLVIAIQNGNYKRL